MKLSEYGRIKWERARDLRRSGKYREAEKELKDALEEDPDHLLLKASLAELYLRQDRLVEARILAEAILSVDPHYPQALYVLGEILFKGANLEEALQYFRQASQKDQRPYLVWRIAKTLREMGRYCEALETLDTILVSQRENAQFLKEKALVLNRMKRWDEALAVYEKVRELDSEDSFVQKEIYRLRGLKRPDQQTIHELKKVINLSSKKDDAQLHGFLGQKLKEAGRLNEAATEFHQAWRLSPSNLFFLKQEGFCHYKRGAYPEAINALSQVFKKTPNDYRIKATLKKIYAAQQDMEGFICLLEEALRDHPQNVKLMGTLKKAKKEAAINENPQSDGVDESQKP